MRLMLVVLAVLAFLPLVQADPAIDSIPDQFIENGEAFDAIHLNRFVSRHEDNARWGVDGMHVLSVSIGKDNVTTIRYPRDWVGEEKLRFFLIDEDGEYDDTYVTFTVVAEGWSPAPYIGPDGPQRPGSCSISTGHGLLPDTDCDRIPDIEDTCPAIGNPDQADADRNGVGDACDVLIVVPEYRTEMPAGRAVSVEFIVQNNLPVPVSDIAIGLNYGRSSAIKPFGSLVPGEARDAQAAVQIPACTAAGAGKLIVFAEFTVSGTRATVSRELPFSILPGECSGEQNRTTFIDVYEIQDVRQGETALYPITIRNAEAYSKQYVLSVEGVDFGNSWFRDGTVLVVPQGGAQTTVLSISPHGDASGSHPFYLKVSSEGFEEKVILTTRVEPRIPSDDDVRLLVFEWLIVLLLVVGLLIALAKHRHRVRRRLH